MKTTWKKMTAGAAIALPMMMMAASAAAAPTVNCRVELDRGVLPAERANRAVVKITLDAPAPPRRNERPPVNLCLVLDRSGSMGGDKIERAKEAAIEAVRCLSEGDIVSLVVYDHEVETLVPAQDAGRIEWIEARIRSIQARGNTALYGGVSQGASEVRKNAGRRRVSRIVLLSDGLANTGPSTPEELARLGTSLMKEGIAVTTIGVGTDYNEDLMTRLASASDGNSYFVENSADLPRIFAAELGDVLSVVAQSVTVEIECGEGVRPIRIIGRDGVIQDNKVHLRLNQLYGGQQKFVLVEVEVPPTRAEQTLRVARATVDYNDALTARPAQTCSAVEAGFSAEEHRVEASANVAVQTDVTVNLAAETRDQAIALSDDGKREEAAQKLRQQAQELREFAEKNDAPALAGAAEQLAREADDVEKDGYDDRSRKAARTESRATVNQQQN